MADTVPEWFTVAFDTAVQHKAQQTRARFAAHARMRTALVGERATFNLLDSVEDTEVTGEKFTLADRIDAPAEARSVFKQDFELRIAIDRGDDLAMLLDPEMGYIEAAANAKIRRGDRLVLTAATADAKSGKNGETTNVFTAGNLVDATAGLTANKMLELRRVFDAAEHMVEDMEEGDVDNFVCALSPRAHEALLQETKTTSGDFYEDPIRGRRPLVDGRITFFAGFRIRITNRAELDLTGTTRTNLAWWRGAIGFGMWRAMADDMTVRTADELTKRPREVVWNYSLGSVRLQESGVFKLTTTES